MRSLNNSSEVAALTIYSHKLSDKMETEGVKVTHLRKWWVQWCKEWRKEIAEVVQECSKLVWDRVDRLYSSRQVSVDLKWGHRHDEDNNSEMLRMVIVRKKRGKEKMMMIDKWDKSNSNLEMYSLMVSGKALVKKGKDKDKEEDQR